ncbi:protein DMR6-LIKE OXYGENASE 2-like [Cynara cardunculus var. scolymus]|uniref:protein DMR6-LIKE OXYGENASE 2-like n=1 Tax=Cynara cardunculus var. scolymus TaxID=59895 RepID=UPI000D628245|nr:protein DMR6-LIKE OXYGENASE 2-like [Cynara cardunculus var. scolymus]
MISMHDAQKPVPIHNLFPTTSFKFFSFSLIISNHRSASAMGEVDPTFIQELQHRPKPAVIEAHGIPQIDLSTLQNSSSPVGSDLEDLVADVRNACKNWGFFQVINHGVPIESSEKVKSAAKRFFDQTAEEKRKVRRDEANPLGYYDTEHTKNVRDWKEVFDFTVEVPTTMPASHDPDDEQTTEYRNQWPLHPPDLRKACEEYVKHVQKLSFKLLELISLSLNLPANRLEPFFSKDQTTFVRLNHYPPCLAPDLALGVGRHKDAGAMTILAQDDVGGLEVKRKTDGEWIFVKPTPNAFIINVGDIIQVWSNDTYESVEHRVRVNSTRERFSIPFFVNPAHYTVVEPLAELTSESNPAKYKAYNWGKFFATRKVSNFKKLDVENIQIYQFKKPNARKIESLVV